MKILVLQFSQIITNFDSFDNKQQINKKFVSISFKNKSK